MLDQSFRKIARYVYALNQSRAKVVLDPIYEQVAARLVPDDLPLSTRLQSKQYPQELFDMFFEYRQASRKLEYHVEDWDWDEARPELLTRRQREFLHTAALGETSGSAVAHGFLKSFSTVPELGAFFGLWFTEELNHFFGFHKYLRQMGEGWPEERAMRVAEVDVIPYAEDPLEVACCNMYQELVGYLVYRSYGGQVADPFLRRMMDRFAKDELRHYKFYQHYVAREIQRDPSLRRTVMKVFLKATTPYNQVAGSVQSVLDHLENGMFYFRRAEFDFFLDQVELLIGDRRESFFRWFFKGHMPPCEGCREDLYLCECEVLEAVPTQAQRLRATA